MVNPGIIHNILASAKDLERILLLEALARQENKFRFPDTQRPKVAVVLAEGAIVLPVLGIKYDPQDWDQDLSIHLLDTREDSPEKEITVDETELLPGEALSLAELIPEEKIDIFLLKPVLESIAGSYTLRDGTTIIIDPANESVTTGNGFNGAYGIGAYEFAKKAYGRTKAGMSKQKAVIETAEKEYGFDLPF